MAGCGDQGQDSSVDFTLILAGDFFPLWQILVKQKQTALISRPFPHSYSLQFFSTVLLHDLMA